MNLPLMLPSGNVVESIASFDYEYNYEIRCMHMLALFAPLHTHAIIS